MVVLVWAMTGLYLQLDDCHRGLFNDLAGGFL
jgi:hypothetical protein